MVGLSKSDCAKRLGISTQQFHKYEIGGNRIPAGRLYEIAIVLNAPLSWLFEEQTIVDPPATDPTKLQRMSNLLKDFNAIGDPAQREILCAMARCFAASANSRNA